MLPQMRKSFELFFIQLSATDMKSLVIVRTEFGDSYEYRGIPFVELMICLSFFGIYFCEECIQSCLRYRKYYWFSNANIMYSDRIYDFTSLNYRLKKTRHYLITCSRKTSEATTMKTIPKSQKDSVIESEEQEKQKDSLEILNMSYDSSEQNSLPVSVHSETTVSSQLPSYWQTSERSDNTKVYLPQLTLATSMPILLVLEGVIIGSQETFDMLWMTFAVILFHKTITGFILSFEIYEKTNCKMMPTTTLISYSFLPAIGLLIVMMFELIFVEPLNERICQMIFSAISAGSLLHIILICVRNNYIELVAPLKNGIIQHFTMYTGFIAVLTSTAFINSKTIN